MPVMFRNTRLFCLSGVIVIFIALLTAVPAKADFPWDVDIVVGDTTGSSGEQNSAISLYLNNYNDEVAAYTLWITLSNPNVMEFNTEVDTVEYQTFYRYTEFDPQVPDSATDSIVASLYWVCQQFSGETCTDSVQLLGYYECLTYDGDDCIDSNFIEGYDVSYIDTVEAQVGDFDTVGTLTSGWERVETRSIGGYGQDMLILAIANEAAPPFTSGISPQWGSNTPLIRIKGDIFEIADNDTNRSVDIRIEYNILDFFGFSDPDGNSIGIVTDTITDTNYYMCLDWFVVGTDSTCNWWDRVDEEPVGGADSIKIFTYTNGTLDTDLVHIYQGSMTVLTGLCGDISGSTGEPDDFVNILDIIALIEYKFSGGAEPYNLGYADVNCDLNVNILDIIDMIDYKFKGGDPLSCCPGQW